MRPDGKTQVTVEYDENNVPVRLDAIVVSTQHAADVSQEQIHEDIRRYVIDEVVDVKMIDDDTKIFINPTGRFVIGGPNGDSGLTGRKIIVDTYGGANPIQSPGRENASSAGRYCSDRRNTIGW